jgi:hypothetical protein
MAKVIIDKTLEKEIEKKFNKKEAMEIANLMYSLEKYPKKGKILGNVGGIVIKEIKYKSFRFYFLADGFKLKFLSEEKLTDLLLRFVRMSDKKHQQETINEIKNILIKIGPKGFE